MIFVGNALLQTSLLRFLKPIKNIFTYFTYDTYFVTIAANEITAFNKIINKFKKEPL